MENSPPTVTDDRERRPTNALRTSLDAVSSTAFLFAGASMVASLLLPIGLSQVTDLGWAVGIALVGLAVLSAAVGLLALYPAVDDRSSRLARIGAISAAIAGVTAFGLVVALGLALFATEVQGTTVPWPVGRFRLAGLLLAGSFASGLLTLGSAVSSREGSPGRAGLLLAVGGALLLAPVAVELLGVLVPVRAPPWLLFPVIGLVAVDVVLAGFVLRSGASGANEPEQPVDAR